MQMIRLFSAVLALSLFAPLAAQNEGEGSSAQDAHVVALPGEDPAEAAKRSASILKIQLRPLTQTELVEQVLPAWESMLRDEAVKVRDAELESLEKGSGADALVPMRAQLSSLQGLFMTVATAVENKGGDVAAAKSWAESLTAVEITGFQAFLDQAQAWVLSKDGGLALLIDIATFLAVFLLAKFVAGIASRMVNRALGKAKNSSKLLRNFIVNTTRKVIVFIGFVLALTFLGVDIGPFLAAIGAAGFVIGFALQGTLSNFASGVMLMIYRPYDIGDVVSVAGVTGSVDDMTLVSTTVKTPDNQTIVVPNSSIWGDVITNITANDTRRVDLVFGIGYGDDIEKASAALKDVVTSHPLVLKDPEPNIQVHELADSSVNFVVRPWSKTSDYWTVYWDLTRSVKERFDKEGISIPFPQQDVYMHQVTAS